MKLEDYKEFQDPKVFKQLLEEAKDCTESNITEEFVKSLTYRQVKEVEIHTMNLLRRELNLIKSPFVYENMLKIFEYAENYAILRGNDVTENLLDSFFNYKDDKLDYIMKDFKNRILAGKDNKDTNI